MSNYINSLSSIHNNNNDTLNYYFKNCFPNTTITDFGNDTLYVTAELNNKIIGIARLVSNFDRHFKTQKNSFLNNEINTLLSLKKDLKFFFLTGIFVEPSYRGQGIGKNLIKERLSLISEGDYIFSDVLKSSTLTKYYFEIGLYSIGSNEDAIFIFGQKRTFFNIQDYNLNYRNYLITIDKEIFYAVIPSWYDGPLDFYIPSHQFYIRSLDFDRNSWALFKNVPDLSMMPYDLLFNKYKIWTPLIMTDFSYDFCSIK